MDAPHSLLIFSTVVALYAFGQIWFAQLVVYPLFAKVGEAEYRDYHHFYSSRIPLPVIVPGFASFVLPVLLLFVRPDSVPAWLAVVNVACALVGLAVTVLLEIPRHAQLVKRGRQPDVIRELVAFNWPRTASITGCAFCCVLMLLVAFRPV
jgi:hypothetical protein